jgi:hypothetical protein
MEEDKLQKIIDERVKKILPGYMKSSAFTDRKLTDTPTDALCVVNRKYVTLNGTSANRPTSSVVGQFYFDTSLGNGKAIYWNGTGFVDAAGNYV